MLGSYSPKRHLPGFAEGNRRSIADILEERQTTINSWMGNRHGPGQTSSGLTSDACVCDDYQFCRESENTSSWCDESFMLLATKKSAAATREQAFSSLFFSCPLSPPPRHLISSKLSVSCSATHGLSQADCGTDETRWQQVLLSLGALHRHIAAAHRLLVGALRAGRLLGVAAFALPRSVILPGQLHI